jgi:hypothetical protein
VLHAVPPLRVRGGPRIILGPLRHSGLEWIVFDVSSDSLKQLNHAPRDLVARMVPLCVRAFGWPHVRGVALGRRVLKLALVGVSPAPSSLYKTLL